MLNREASTLNREASRGADTDPCICAHSDTKAWTCAHFDRGGNNEGGPINGACSEHLQGHGVTPQAHGRANISIYHSRRTLSATQSAQHA